MLASCSDELADVNAGLPEGVVELTGVQASVVSNMTPQTRADGDNSPSPTPPVVYLPENISRYKFENNDKMFFTKIKRTTHDLAKFNYSGIEYSCNTSGAWNRDKTKGTDGYNEVPQRIYWSDATNPHTFIGYSVPNNASFDWAEDTGTHVFSGSIGDGTNSGETIDFNGLTNTTYTAEEIALANSIISAQGYVPGSDKTAERIANYTAGTQVKPYELELVQVKKNGKAVLEEVPVSSKMKGEDLLLTYSESLVADESVANILFYHALSSIKVKVNINRFYGSEIDGYVIVKDMKLYDQPTLYKWDQRSATVQPKSTNHSDNLPKNMILWDYYPKGSGTGAGKSFSFYGLTVPQELSYFTANSGRSLNLDFKVKYPNPLKTNLDNKEDLPDTWADNDTRWMEKPYSATITTPVYFHPGQTTIITITMTHTDQELTIGAEYMDWQFVDTPDEGKLKKNSTFLEGTNREEQHVTIAADNTTKDDATWLYYQKQDGAETGVLRDIYDNDGSASKPFTISTAKQLLSFAYEVNSGRDFSHLFVKLDADITLQPEPDLTKKELEAQGVTSGDTYNGAKQSVSWIGIGNETYNFNGFFLGSGRHINRLYGNHFFNEVGDNAVIDKLNFDNVVEVLGCGVIAHKNKGLICGCYIEGDVKETGESSQYTGSIVGENDSFIIACAHVGTVSGRGTVGGLVGFNNGTVMASYHAGEIVALDSSSDIHATVGKRGDGENGTNKSIMFSCYYDNNLIKHTPKLEPNKSGYPLSTAMMQSSAFVNSDKIFLYDTSNKYTSQGKTLREVVLEDILEVPDVDQTPEQLAALIFGEDGILSPNVWKLFEYHFSLNEALDVFRYWLNAIAADAATKEDSYKVVTNCHDFTKEQIRFLQQHYSAEHKFVYVPASYPKVQ